MTHVLEYLERLACSVEATPPVAPAALTPDVRSAIATGDCGALARALGGRAAMACSIWAPEEQPVREDDPDLPEPAPEEREPDAA